jgi:glutathione S-transferase
MHTIILHHYPASPYCEKARLMLGFKALAWQSVIIPRVMPKPDLMPLTGGYRKAPVLQIGRDVICDTRLMARLLDRLYPEKSLAPAAHKANVAAWAQLEQTLFFAAVATNFQPEGLKVMAQAMGAAGLEEFGKDRAALFAGGSARRPNVEFGKLHLLPLLHALDVQLAHQPFVLGETPTLVDFMAYHPAWFVRANPGVAATLDPLKNLLAWMARIKAVGHGQKIALEADAALVAARESAQWLEFDGPLLEPEGITLGQPVMVRATDYGVDPVQGTLVHASVFELVVERQDARAGTVRVHFPRQDFSVVPAHTH